MRIAVVYSLPSRRLRSTIYGSIDEDSAVIAKMVARGLEFKGHTVQLCPIGEEEIAKIGEIQADCVFNLIEWCGQDIELAKQAFKYLRVLKIPVTGDTEAKFVLSGDKIAMKREMEKRGVPTPRAIAFATGEEEIPPALPYPMLVKPATEHCSVGLSRKSIANNAQELRQIAKGQIASFNQPALAEEFIVGRELMVYLLEEPTGVRVLPIEEVIFGSHDPLAFQTYSAKWVETDPDYRATDVQPAKLTIEEQTMVEQVSARAFTAIGLRGYARLDVRMRVGQVYILEINANPSVFDGDEEMKDINEEVIWGIKFPDYLETIVQAAVDHYGRGERV